MNDGPLNMMTKFAFSFWNLDKITTIIVAYDLFAFDFEKTIVSLNVFMCC